MEQRRDVNRERDPIDMIRRYTREMDRWFDRKLDQWSGQEPGAGMRWPALEKLDRGNELVIRAEMPGMKREDVRVQVIGDTLVIAGERRNERERESGRGRYDSEWSYGRFSREIPIPQDVDSSRLRAHMDDGVLELTLPYREERRARDIEIERGIPEARERESTGTRR